MRAWTRLIGAPVALLAVATEVSAEPVWSYRARVSFEAQGARANRSSPLVPPGTGRWDTSSLFVAAADSSWENGSRLKLAGGLVAFASSDNSVTLQAREAYARISATSWMDVEAGKRLVRWGVGYGFSPTGVLNPPRLATDPTDRLGRNEGMPLVRADLFHGNTSLTLAIAAPALWRDNATPGAPSRLFAARVGTVLPGGLEVAVIGSAAPERRAAIGGNVTHVVGQRLEWHAEVLVHDAALHSVETLSSEAVAAPFSGADRRRRRTVSAVAGFQYTLPGTNVVMEYHRRGTDGPPGGPMNGLLFVRAARSGADVKIAPELIVIRGMNDRGWTTVAGVGWRVRRRVEIYARATHLGGPRTSRAGMAPVSWMASLGSTVRF